MTCRARRRDASSVMGSRCLTLWRVVAVADQHQHHLVGATVASATRGEARARLKSMYGPLSPGTLLERVPGEGFATAPGCTVVSPPERAPG